MLLAAYIIICISWYFLSLNEYKLATGNIKGGDWLMLPLAAGIYKYELEMHQRPSHMNDDIRVSIVLLPGANILNDQVKWPYWMMNNELQQLIFTSTTCNDNVFWYT